ncbi:hypothetical protein J3A83DRAFT_4086785 [Scleroderma citrinum]
MVSSVTTDSPFGITQSYSLRIEVDPIEKKAPAAKNFTGTFNKVLLILKNARKLMKLQGNKVWSHTPDYQIEQQVWLSTDNLWMLNRVLKKLMEK